MLTTSLPKNQQYSQEESLRDCTAPKPLEYLRIQGFANNEIRFTVRSKSLGPSRVHLLDEAHLIGRKDSRRNNPYGDSYPQKLKNRADRLRAFLMWLSQIESELGWHTCPVPDIFTYCTPTENYKGKPIKSDRLTFAVHPDGTMSGWDEEAGQFVCSVHIATARAKIQALLDVANELQVTLINSAELGGDNRATAFTRRARHTLLEAGDVMQSLCPSVTDGAAANARAITLTLPGSTPEALRACAAWSSWLLNCLMQEVRDCRHPVYYFSVWELQKRGALHLHLCIGGNPDQVSMEFLKTLGDRLIARWFELLKVMGTRRKVSRGGKTGRLPGIDMFARSETAIQARGGPKSWRDYPEKWQADNQPIKKNVAAYFSKYASKNATSGNKNKVFNAYSPSRWWSCSTNIREEIKKYRFDYTVAYHPVESNQLIEDCLEVWPSDFQYSYDFRIISKHEEEGKETTSINVVNGITKICYWDKAIFKEAHQAFKDLKSTFSETGRLREQKETVYTPVDTCRQI